MNKEPSVLTRMRLSCCWGDNLNEKELNEVVDYINYLQQENQKYKEVIDKVSTRLEYFLIGNLKYQSSQKEFIKLLNILKELE